MPMHDWARVKAGTYDTFHFRWIVWNVLPREIRRLLEAAQE
jgi:hypothetical protein